jgi:hypothetical protein
MRVVVKGFSLYGDSNDILYAHKIDLAIYKFWGSVNDDFIILDYILCIELMDYLK